MSTVKHGSLVVLALTLAVSEVSAQARPATRQPATQRQAAAAPDQGFWELGTDMSVALGIDDPKTFSIDIPTGLVRAGYFVTPALSLEPSLVFSSTATENQTAQSFWMLQLGGVYHLSTDRRQQQIFIHPSIGFTGGSGGGPNFTFLNAFVGIKEPIMGGRLALRCEAGLSHRLKEGPVDGATSIVATLGWSVYTR
jgi:hypothetical protein